MDMPPGGTFEIGTHHIVTNWRWILNITPLKKFYKSLKVYKKIWTIYLQCLIKFEKDVTKQKPIFFYDRYTFKILLKYLAVKNWPVVVLVILDFNSLVPVI